MGRVRRAHHPGVAGPESEILLDPEESRHVRRVLRLRAGDELAVFDGDGREWYGLILTAGSDAVRVRIGEEMTGPVEPTLPVTLFQALSRSERMEWVIQKATEIGVTAVRPIVTERVEVRRPSPARVGRWRRIAVEAAKQSGRRRVPEVAEPAGTVPPPPAGTLALLLHGEAGVAPLGRYLLGEAPAAVWIAIGPEGGFSSAEVDEIVSSGWQPAGLGSRTLRTETAGVVAGALVLHTWADLGA